MTTQVLIHSTPEYTLVIEYEGEPIDDLISVDIQFKAKPLALRRPPGRRGLQLSEEDQQAEERAPYARLENA